MPQYEMDYPFPLNAAIFLPLGGTKYTRRKSKLTIPLPIAFTNFLLYISHVISDLLGVDPFEYIL